LQRREARGVFGDFAEDNFLNRCFATPVFVIAAENHVTPALEPDKSGGTRADPVLIYLIAVLIPGNLADDETIPQSIQENRQWLLGHEDNRLIVRRLYFSYVVEV